MADMNDNMNKPGRRRDFSSSLSELEARVNSYSSDIERNPFPRKIGNSKKTQKNPKKVARVLKTAAAAVFGVFLFLYIISICTLPSDKTARNIYVENINVGSMTYDEMLEAMSAGSLFHDQQVTLRCGSHSYAISGADIGLVGSPEETADKAFNYAKGKNFLVNGFKNMLLIFKKHVIVPVADVDDELLSEELNNFGVEIYGELVNHSIEANDNNEVVITPGHTGFDGNTSQALEEVLNAFDKEKFKNISVTLKSCPPPDLTAEDISNAVYADPVDATYEISDDNVTIIDHSVGRYVDADEAAAAAEEVKEGADPVIIPWYPTEPEKTTLDLENRLFSSVLASYSTNYSSSTENRASNVARAASLLDGAVIASGDIFSFNDRVGDRTEANGFYTAPEYVGGETVQGVGGGTCQVSTTLYSAVLYADMAIISRTNHMFPISYAPLGQDATVSYGTIDFKFQNSSDYPIKISARTDGSNIYIEIIGTEWEDHRIIKIDNQVSYGKDTSTGTSVTSTRKIYVGGECVDTEKLPSSYYKPH